MTRHVGAGEDAAATSELVLGDVCKRYGATVAVDRVSFSIAEEEFVTILGPSGSGKTTLLHMIAGFLFPDAGSVFYRGINITYMPAHLRNMGMVFQNYALFPHMTVAENLAFPLRMRRARRGEISRRVTEVLELVGLAGKAGNLPWELSGGQQQRIALARSLIYHPSLLLMDEPLGALDKGLRERLQVEIKRIQRATGVTILYVTHDQQEALSMSDRIAVMAEGRLSAIGPARDIYERPPNRFVAGLIGECNFLAGRVVGNEAGLLTVALGGQIIARVAGPGPGTGRAVTLCVRPESIVVGESDLPDYGCQTLRARLVEVVYLGDVMRYELALDAGDAAPLLIAKSLRTSGRPLLSRGSEVLLHWDIRDAWLLAEETGKA